eukprot:Skav209213  [mRNA]  locus=scaffold1751:22952:23329:- [translate_table: standard]
MGAMVKARAAAVLLLLGLCCSWVFVPAPGHVAPVAAGALGMLAAVPADADKIDDAAKVLSEESYPFLMEIDWTSDVDAKLPLYKPLAAMRALDKMFVMGAAMDREALKKGVPAHVKAIGKMDSGL